MTPAEAADHRATAAECRRKSADLAAIADLLDRYVKEAGYPTSAEPAEPAEIIAFPAAPWSTRHGGRPAGLDGDAEVIAIGERCRSAR